LDTGAKKFTAAIASKYQGGTIEIRLDSTNGQLVGTLKINSTGSIDNYQAMTCRVKGAKGVHDLWFVFKGQAQKDLFHFDWLKFE